MAAGYQYKLLHGDAEMDIDEDNEKPIPKQRRAICPILSFVFLFLAVIGLLVLLIVVEHRDSNNGQVEAFTMDGSSPCMTPKCIETSNTILEAMDTQVNPCTDMYSYACGGWLKEQTLPPGYAKWSRFSEIHINNGKHLRKYLEDNSTMLNGQESTAIAKLKSYYRACMDVETIKAKGTRGIKEIIKKYGPWTVTNDEGQTWDENRWNFQESLFALHRIGSSALFSFYIGKDSKNTSQLVIKFGQSGLTLASIEEYSNNRSEEFREAFFAFATDLGVLLGGQREYVKTKMEQVYNFEKELSEISDSIVKMRDPYNTYNKMTLKEFQDMQGSWVDIQHYLSSFFGYPFLPSEEIIVTTPDYFKKLGRIVEKTDKEVLANYMMWILLQQKLTYLSDDFVETSFPLTKLEEGVASLPDRWKKCFNHASGAIGFAASALYVKEHFRPSSKNQIVLALHKITQQFIKNLASVPWLDTITRDHLQEKAESISYKVGYPDWILDPNALDDYYKNLIVQEGEFLENSLHLTSFGTMKQLNKYGKPPDNSEWSEYPHTVNAFYDGSSNEVIVPAGILQPPFYSPYFPKALLYSAIGMGIGHEITHAFDNRGRKFDKYGNLHEQWTDATSQQYEKNAKCMIEQYQNYTLHGHHMNGKLTLNENIADNGGFLIAYKAFKDDHSPEKYHLPGVKITDDQMFYLGFSQLWCSLTTENYEITTIDTGSHSLGKFRVKGVLNNHPQFAEAFNCPKNSPMAEAKQCKVW